jgi:hypothetical protein
LKEKNEDVKNQKEEISFLNSSKWSERKEIRNWFLKFKQKEVKEKKEEVKNEKREICF